MKKAFFILCFFLPARLVQAQPTLGLEAISQQIAQHHPSLQRLDAESKSYKEAAAGAYAWNAPELGAGLFMTPFDPGRWSYKNGQPGKGALMISAQQMFPNPAKQKARYHYLEALSGVEAKTKDVWLNNLMAEARGYYYDWQVMERKLRIIDESRHLLEFMIQSAEIRYKNGLGKISAYYKAKAALEDLDRSVEDFHSRIAADRISLNKLMTWPADSLFGIDSSISWINFDSLATDSSTWENRRSDLAVLKSSMQANQLAQESELADLKPDFGIRYDQMLGWARQPWLFNLMVTVKIPLAPWSAKGNKARVESLRWKNEALQQQEKQVLNDAPAEATTALLRLQSSKRQLDQYEKKIIPALLRNFQTLELGYEQNTEDLFVLFDAWEALNAARLQMLDEMEQGLQWQNTLARIYDIK